jgi:hypothetical protein
MAEEIELRRIKFRWENGALLIKRVLPPPFGWYRTCDFLYHFFMNGTIYQHQILMKSSAFPNKNAAEIAWIFYKAPT